LVAGEEEGDGRLISTGQDAGGEDPGARSFGSTWVGQWCRLEFGVLTVGARITWVELGVHHWNGASPTITTCGMTAMAFAPGLGQLTPSVFATVAAAVHSCSGNRDRPRCAPRHADSWRCSSFKSVAENPFRVHSTFQGSAMEPRLRESRSSSHALLPKQHGSRLFEGGFL